MLGEEINRISHGSDSGQSLLRDGNEVYDRLQQIADEDDSDSEGEENDKLHNGGIGDHEANDVELGTLPATTPRTPGSGSGSVSGQRSPALHIVRTPDHDDNEGTIDSSTGELAGVYLGILNLFVTMPQFVGSFVSFVVFAILEPGKSPELAGRDDSRPAHTKGVNAIAVTMTMGGFGSLVAAYRTYRLRKVR